MILPPAPELRFNQGPFAVDVEPVTLFKSSAQPVAQPGWLTHIKQGSVPAADSQLLTTCGCPGTPLKYSFHRGKLEGCTQVGSGSATYEQAEEACDSRTDCAGFSFQGGGRPYVGPRCLPLALASLCCCCCFAGCCCTCFPVLLLLLWLLLHLLSCVAAAPSHLCTVAPTSLCRCCTFSFTLQLQLVLTGIYRSKGAPITRLETAVGLATSSSVMQLRVVLSPTALSPLSGTRWLAKHAPGLSSTEQTVVWMRWPLETGGLWLNMLVVG